MKSGRQEVFSEINITPLTDIFLVLLIIMMVVAPLLEYRQLDMAVASPEAAVEPDPKEESKVVHLVIAADGAYTVGANSVSSLGLVDAIRDEAIEKPEGIVIETHPDAAFEHMARAMDAAEVAGIIHVTTAETDLTPPEPPKEEKKPAPKKTSTKKTRK
jgi:biopolymer transport protein ExbD/biopolymer transport protein TolR